MDDVHNELREALALLDRRAALLDERERLLSEREAMHHDLGQHLKVWGAELKDANRAMAAWHQQLRRYLTPWGALWLWWRGAAKR